MKPILKADDLCISLKHKNDFLTKNISFKLLPGQVLGIIGESGSGKSITGRAIMGLLDSRHFRVSGSVLFDDYNLVNKSQKEMKQIRGNRIAMIMQNPMDAFDPVTRIGKQIIETLYAHRLPGNLSSYEQLIEHELINLGLTDYKRIINSYPYELSGGMLQRIMIAIGLLLSPDILIADEATTALDVQTQASILKEFKKIKATGISIILITHNFGVLAELADEVIVMKEGTVVEQGSIYQIFDTPTCDYTKELLEASALRKELQNG